jgi:hypothetical protein
MSCAPVEFFNEQSELCVFYDDAATISYSAIASWAECPTPNQIALPVGDRLGLGEPSSYRFVGLGWYEAENIGGPQARWAGEIATSTLRLVLPPGNIRIRFRAAAYPTDQTVTVSVNSQTVGTAKLTNDWADYDLIIPADVVHANGPSIITLTHARLESAFERTGGASQDRRPLAAAYDYFVLSRH